MRMNFFTDCWKRWVSTRNCTENESTRLSTCHGRSTLSFPRIRTLSMVRVIFCCRMEMRHHSFDLTVPLHSDISKRLFEGTLRSVLVCRKCGTKRTQSEPFMSLSLPLLKEVQNLPKQPGATSPGLSVELCLRHFVMPESLADPVDCPSCRQKTPTTKQHVVAKLPRILCLHLKRFDATLNRKIEDPVAFPAKGLNMGPFLPHW